jgi:hypothetical protein
MELVQILCNDEMVSLLSLVMDGQRHQALTGVRQLLAFVTSPELRTHTPPNQI